MLFVGVYDPNVRTYETLEIEELESIISRDTLDRRSIAICPHFALVTVDFEFDDAPFFIKNEGASIGVVVGNPYISEAGARNDRERVLEILEAGDCEALCSSRGSYAAVLFDSNTRTLRLASDKVGVYPIYIAKIGARVYFSNAIRMLVNLKKVDAHVDFKRLMPRIAFGYCLAEKTVYGNINRIYGGEVLRFVDGSHDRHRYWSWANVVPVSRSPEELREAVFDTFIDSVRIRSTDSPGELSFLSGGLDSRAIVAALRHLGRMVWTLNFAPEGSQDHYFGRLAADALETTHFESESGSNEFLARQRIIMHEWANENKLLVESGVNPHRVWSGDGGSVGLGHVYLDNEFIQYLRAGCYVDAVAYFMKKGRRTVPAGILSSKLRKAAVNIPQEAMLAELRSFECSDPAKSGFLFLLLNDQRQHLAGYFEDLDKNKYELVLPFFDSSLLELILSAPIDGFLYHSFYNEWLQKFGPSASLIPWQAYPEHVACPVDLDIPLKLRNQWKDDWFDQHAKALRRDEEVSRWSAMLTSSDFPKNLLDRKRLKIALFATSFGIRDYAYALSAAETIISLIVPNSNSAVIENATH